MSNKNAKNMLWTIGVSTYKNANTINELNMIFNVDLTGGLNLRCFLTNTKETKNDIMLLIK